MNVPETFEGDLAAVFQFDGFKDDRAPGESFATAYGVTERSWGDAVDQGIVEDKPISEATLADCTSIIRVNYWNAIRAAQLPVGVALMVFNDAVLCGKGHAVKLLQRILGFVGDDVDGVVGPNTIHRAGSYGDKKLIDAIHDGDDTYFAALATAPLYLKGWLRREDVMRAKAYAMIGVPV